MQSVFTGTPYVGGLFKVKLTLGKDFPQIPPKAFFLTKIFHPNVATKGEICVNTLKKDWKPDLGIKHILLVNKKQTKTLCKSLLQFFCFFLDHKVLAHRSKRRIGIKWGSWQTTLGALRWLFSKGENDDRNSCTGFCFFLRLLLFKCLRFFVLQPQKSKTGTSDGPLAKKHAGDKKLSAEKKKILKDKKRTLKRLWK